MKITYDASADAAYIYLIDNIKSGAAAKTLPCDPGINLDFNADGQLIGIEILDASKRLPSALLVK